MHFPPTINCRWCQDKGWIWRKEKGKGGRHYIKTACQHCDKGQEYGKNK